MYKKLLKDIDLSVGKHIRIPAPQYIVFYNGQERNEEEFIQKLSEAYEDGKEGCLELTVRTININKGHNGSLLEKSPSLYGYSYLYRWFEIIWRAWSYERQWSVPWMNVFGRIY